jgi:hypothetical protein
MQLDRIQGDVRRRRRARGAASPMPAPPTAALPARATTVVAAPADSYATPARRVDPRVIDQGSARTYRTFEVGPVSKAGGEWTVDWERAHADAQKVLDAIDFSKRDIVVWVPGTSNHGPHRSFEAAVRDSYTGEGSNLVALEYEATWHLRRSVPTGVATMRLVLEGIRARGGDHRVLLAGESQGAWIIGEVLADPAVTKVVDRAVLMGHPWLATHQYANGQDPRVRVINHEGDLVTMPVKGDPTVGLDAMLAIRTLDISKAGSLVKGIALNPTHAVELLKSIAFAIPGLKSLMRNPHVYDGEMTRAVEFLRHGTLPVSSEYAKLMGRPQVPAELADPAHDEEAHRRLVRGAAIAAYSQLRAA